MSRVVAVFQTSLAWKRAIKFGAAILSARAYNIYGSENRVISRQGIYSL